MSEAPALEAAPSASIEASAVAVGAAGVEALARMPAERRVRVLAEIVRTQDYFGILHVERTASTEELRASHASLRALLSIDALPPELVGLAREVIRSLDEARDVLSVPALRASYQQHLRP
ncbi:hypothetical protein L6R52_38115 [Myxococcota bacterium]|nr:hypothetical protein [Myxococcota bacterium]